MKKYTLPVEGMTCASCVARVEKVVGKFDGLKNVAVNFATEKVSFETEEDNFDLTEVKKAVEDYGYKIVTDEKPAETKTDDGKTDESSAHYQSLKKELVFAAILTVPIFLISMLFDFSFFKSVWPFDRLITNKILLILTTPVIFVSGKRFYKIFATNLKHFSFEMNSLVAIGTGAAYGFSVFNTLFPEISEQFGIRPDVYFETSVVIITLILFGRLLEERAKKRTGDSIKKLLELKPKTAIVLRDGKEYEVELNDLKPGQTVVIKPGNKIPADGTVNDGFSTVDESLLTGESIPVEKKPGDKVIGGTINQKGSFNFEISVTGDNSVLGQIIKMVESAQASKAPIQKLADKISGIFVPAVVGVAIITFTGWLIYGGLGTFNYALTGFIAVLIIACPCALGLATPTAIIVGTGRGALQGILIKNGETLERAHKINTLFLDKTGTITEGKPRVTDVISLIDETEHLRFCASLERKSEHPIADSIMEFVNSKDILPDMPENFDSITGMGIKGTVSGKTVLIGNEAMMNKFNIAVDEIKDDADKLSGLAKTVIFTAIDNKLAGIVAVEDPIKESSEAAVKQILSEGIEVIMITGDNKTTAASIAERTGIGSFRAELLPEDKLTEIKTQQKNGKVTAMVGDGVNDAPALAQADIGFAIGTGSDSAIETADITLVQNDLNNVYRAIVLSKKTFGMIKQNLFWAFIYNILGIPLAAFGLLNPMIAATAMSFSSVFVVTNSLRLKKVKI